jgi:S-adenosylmethionine:tRNA ribosyltransferase-isomerase
MRLADFEYHLPSDRIALKPVERRDQSRLMWLIRSSEEISHHRFSDLPDLLQPSDLIVLNNTKVFPARLLGQRKGITSGPLGKGTRLKSKIEMLMLRPLDKDIWEVLVKPGRKMRTGERVAFGDGKLEAKVLGRGPLGIRKVQLYYSGKLDEILDQLGHIPLPPYIPRPDDSEDRQRYQTVYAKSWGAVAAPTAGLHFTEYVFDRLREKGIEWCEITLHVGLGTFQPIHSEQIEEHRMESERFQISSETASIINQAKDRGRRVIAVGTTTVRALESAALQTLGKIKAAESETSLFISPGFRFRVVDGLLTNFHLPRSTLLVLVSAFAGREVIGKAYQQAIHERYRFYSYGDCMLIL